MPTKPTTEIIIRPAQTAIHGLEVVTPVGTFYRETLERARETAALQAKAHGLSVREAF